MKALAINSAKMGLSFLVFLFLILLIAALSGVINTASGETSDLNKSKDLPAVTTGTFEFGIGKNSATDLESINMALDLQVKDTEIKFLLNSQQKEQKVEALNIEADFQGNLIFSKKMFGFGSFGYLRDLSWYDDFIRIGVGLGYTGIAGLKIQSGVHWAIVNQENLYNRKTLSKTTMDLSIPTGSVLTFQQVMDFELNLGEIQGINSVFNDYLTSWGAAVTADITKTIFLTARYRWRYIDNSITAPGNQREYGLTLGARL